tara:strand:- start:571 stop:1356 length:786 start_codon:yes stop_codon:yes gene_type:complete
MNIFFGLETDIINSNLKIPRFKNNSNLRHDVQLVKAEINQNKKWKISKPINNFDDYFYFIENKNLSDNEIYFLSLKSELDLNQELEIDCIKNFSNYTKTKPAYRCSLNIENNYGGFSSYQSEYPFKMTNSNGSILSPITNLLNKNSDKKIIFFRNIYHLPLNLQFDAYIIDYKKKKIIDRKIFYTNKTNIFEIENNYLNDGVFLFIDGFLGIPIYYMEKNNHISFEHTHPLTEYILDINRYKIISNLKNEFKNIVKKNYKI